MKSVDENTNFLSDIMRFHPTFAAISRYLLIRRNMILILSLGFVIIVWDFIPQKRQSFPLILLYTHNRSIKTRDNICRGLRNDGHIVNFDKCPMKCEFSCRIEDFYQRSPDALLFFGEDFYWPFQLTDQNRTSFQQRWIFWSWEAPVHHQEYTKSLLTFNWTMTYRQDSDIVYSYGRYILRNFSHRIRDYQSVDYYLSSTTNQSTFDIYKEFHRRENRILWIVSNCDARTKRNEIAKELGTLFPIDKFGKCSQTKKLPNVEELLFNYKFYLAFENAHCRDYITEKAFYNSLAHGSIPIVLGADQKNSRKILPPNSFLHIEQFKDLKQLAQQLQQISNQSELFASYHQWRSDYRLVTWKSSYFIDDRFCDLCLKLHEDVKPKTYSNFSNWLNQCT